MREGVERPQEEDVSDSGGLGKLLESECESPGVRSEPRPKGVSLVAEPKGDCSGGRRHASGLLQYVVGPCTREVAVSEQRREHASESCC